MTHDADCDSVIGRPCNCGGYEMSGESKAYKLRTIDSLIWWLNQFGDSPEASDIKTHLLRLTEIDKHFELVMNPETGEYGCKAITT